MKQPKKLIEVALPIKEISAESVRDKSIRHGHISTLHLWWARRPLPVCRAVVFASLVPDPLDENCPQEFKDAVGKLLGPKSFDCKNLQLNTPPDQYKPYDSIPFTTAIDPMEDNLRNRLLMFIGKFSNKFTENEKNSKKTDAKDQLSEWSLIKWDNKNNEEILNKARKLIWVANDPINNTLGEFDKYYNAIKKAEKELYTIPDRHIETEKIKIKQEALQKTIETFLARMPKVFDPFAGGGAIPLEAARLGCKTYGNDINPVAHIIQKGSLEFPQKYGKPIIYTKDEFIRLYGEDEYKKMNSLKQSSLDEDEKYIKIENRLAFDVEFYAKKLLKMAENEIGHLYPIDENGNKPVAYYWARVATCSNPTCKAEVPLLKQFYLCNKDNKKIYLKPLINGSKIDFEIKTGDYKLEGWNYRGNLKCPCCGNTTDVKQIKEQNIKGVLKNQLLAVICEGENSKEYRIPYKYEIDILNQIPKEIESFRPTEGMQRNSAGGDTFSWGITKWGQMFSHRQLLAMQTLIKKLQEIKKELLCHYEERSDEVISKNEIASLPLAMTNIRIIPSPFEGEGQGEGNFSEYPKAIITYLGILIDRVSSRLTSFGLWHTKGEKLEQPFGRQAIPMVFDYPESNPFCNSTGGALNQLDWIIRYIEGESISPFSSICNNSSSGDKMQFENKSLNAVITDPPYYDAIAYADLSDFFYVWLKRTLGDVYTLNFATPLTPKADECTALKHHHDNSAEKAKQHFENKLWQIFDSIEKQTSGTISIMFAHQSTEAWTTLVHSILKANMNITGSWAIDTEMMGALKTDKAFLSSSVTVSCRPSLKSGYGDFKEIKKAIEQKVKEEVKTLYRLGFRGADLLTACFGQAVSVFGQYEKVEKADGTEVTVAELLEMARDSAFNTIISDIDTDDVTKFYIGWLNLFGFTEAEHDDVRRITQIGLNIDIDELLLNNIIIRNGNKESIANYKERVNANAKLGNSSKSFAIDIVHQAMNLFSGAKRADLLKYIDTHAGTLESNFWRVLNSLAEILPVGSDDHKQAIGLLTNKESLIRESQQIKETKPDQLKLDI